MKKNLLLIALLLTATISVNAQAGVYLYSPNLPGETTTGVHANETLISSFIKSYTQNIVSVTSGGVTQYIRGANTASTFKISKNYSKVSLPILGTMFTTAANPPTLGQIEIRFYNTANTMYYRITLGSPLLAFYESSGEGCTTGCPGIIETIEFNITSVKEEDLVTNTFKCFNFGTRTATCPN